MELLRFRHVVGAVGAVTAMTWCQEVTGRTVVSFTAGAVVAVSAAWLGRHHAPPLPDPGHGGRGGGWEPPGVPGPDDPGGRDADQDPTGPDLSDAVLAAVIAAWMPATPSRPRLVVPTQHIRWEGR